MDYPLLTELGNLGFYQSCEVTEIFLCRKSDKAVFNFFTLCVFEEKPFTDFNQTFIGTRIRVNEDFSVGIQRYWLSMEEAAGKISDLHSHNRWSADGVNPSLFPQLKPLAKQFIPATDGHRVNHVLKNNFHNGCYILEFFDDKKTHAAFLLKMESLRLLTKICEEIKNKVPIDLSVCRDRVGNFIFQFPINVVETSAKALSSWEGVHMNFIWHPAYTTIPDCVLQVESTLDKNLMGAVLEDYNGTNQQNVIIGNLDQINHIRVWRKKPNLILSSFTGSYIRDFAFQIGIMNPEPRRFEVDGVPMQIEVASPGASSGGRSGADYTTYITNSLYDNEKRALEQSLSFKQYNKGLSGGVEDLQKLIQQKDKDGVYLWDPFLTSTDIIKTLFFSKSARAPLRAIGSINDTVKKVYDKKGIAAADMIAEYKAVLDNPQHNNYQLNLEFRIQHSSFGWPFHDRFLIFPSTQTKRAQVYSLGTSVNSYGASHHILQEVSYPQPVIDAFNELWDQLNDPACLVWKH